MVGVNPVKFTVALPLLKMPVAVCVHPVGALQVLVPKLYVNGVESARSPAGAT
jgi:hypothetical protein